MMPSLKRYALTDMLWWFLAKLKSHYNVANSRAGTGTSMDDFIFLTFPSLLPNRGNSVRTAKRREYALPTLNLRLCELLHSNLTPLPLFPVNFHAA